MKYDHYLGRGFHRWEQGTYSAVQIEALSDVENPFVLLSGAYRSGKSEILARKGLTHAYLFPRSAVGVFRNFLASIRQTTLITLLELTHPSWVADWSNTALVLTLKNGSVIRFLGADRPDKLGSSEFTLALVDEGSELSEESLGMVSGRLSARLTLPSNFSEYPVKYRDLMMRSQACRQLLIATNPKTPAHHLYKNYIEAKKPGVVHYSSNTLENPNLPPAYVHNLVAANSRASADPGRLRWAVDTLRPGPSENPDYSEALRYLETELTPFGLRNVLGRWVAQEGAIYSLDEYVHLASEAPESWVPTGETYAGVDFGFHNPRIVVAKRYTATGQSAYLSIDYWPTEANGELEDGALIQKLIEFHHTYNLKAAYLPPDDPDLLRRAKRTEGAPPIRKARNAVADGIRTVDRFINEGLIRFSGDPEKRALCWEEMQGYRWEKVARTGIWLDTPVKEADHYPDALRYLVYTRHYRDTPDAVEAETPSHRYYLNTGDPIDGFSD